MGLKLQGDIELTLDDLKPLIDKYLIEKHGVPATRVEFRKGGGIRAYIDHPISTPEPTQQVKAPKAKKRDEKAPKTRFKHQWSGLYGAIGEVIEKQRSRRKKFLTFDDLRAELLEKKDAAGNLLFVKGGEELPMSTLKQRLAPSQLERQAKKQENLKGVENQGVGLKI